MIIAADHNIPAIKEYCADLDEVCLFDSRDLPGLRVALRDAEVLLCRSTVRVGGELLEGTPVRFVATATAGTDHVDTAWLASQGIAFASAAGSNARSVAEWWASALLELNARGRISLQDARVGIVGVGHVGTEVADVARALGMRCLYNDPPRKRRGEQTVPWDETMFSSFDDILGCDIVSLHVPLERSGEFATARFFGAEQFRRMSPGALFVNAARGDVMQSDAVLDWASEGNPVVLDVYPGEPRIDPALVRAADFATPHIAGHAWDGKLRGTEMVVAALRAWLHESTCGTHRDATQLGAARTSARSGTEEGPALWAMRSNAPKAHSARRETEERSTLTNCREDMHSQVLDTVRAVYDIRIDDAALRESVEMGSGAAATEFARLRAEYRTRREFAFCEIDGVGLSSNAATILRALGFVIS